MVAANNMHHGPSTPYLIHSGSECHTCDVRQAFYVGCGECTFSQASEMSVYTTRDLKMLLISVTYNPNKELKLQFLLGFHGSRSLKVYGVCQQHALLLGGPANAPIKNHHEGSLGGLLWL